MAAQEVIKFASTSEVDTSAHEHTAEDIGGTALASEVSGMRNWYESGLSQQERQAQRDAARKTAEARIQRSKPKEDPVFSRDINEFFVVPQGRIRL